MYKSCRTAHTFRIVALGVALFTLSLSGCAVPFLQSSRSGGGSSLGSDGTVARDALADDLVAAGVPADTLEGIVSGAVGSITSGGQGSTEDVVTGLVEGAQRSLSGLTGLTDAERSTLIETIVTSAVGSVGAVGSVSVNSSAITASTLFSLGDPTPRARAVAAIVAASIGTLDESGLANENVPGVSEVATGAVIRALRAAGITGREIAALLELIGVRAVGAVGAGVAGLDNPDNDPDLARDVALETIAGVMSGMTSSLDEANLDGVDIDTDLALLLRSATVGAVASVPASGVSGADDQFISDAIRTVTNAATGAVRNVRLETTDPAAIQQTISRTVREITAGATQALVDANEAAGAPTDFIQINVRAVVNGTTRGINVLKQGLGDQVTDFAEIVQEVARGAAESVERVSRDNPEVDPDELVDDLKAEIAAISAELDELRDEINRLHDEMAALVAEGIQQAANGAPVPSLAIGVDGAAPAAVSSDAVVTAATNVIVALDASGSSDPDGDAFQTGWYFDFGPAVPRFFASSADAQGWLDTPASVTPIDPRGGNRSTIFAVFDRAGDYAFTLTLDDGLAVAETFFTISIPGASADNRAPIAVARSYDGAGNRRTLFSLSAGSVTVRLDAGDSSDPDGDPLNFTWSVPAAPAGSTPSPADPAAADTTLTLSAAGTYFVLLQVDDGSVVDEEFLFITVEGAPIADAGANRVSAIGQRIVLDGTNSRDPDGDTIDAYNWRVVTKPPLSGLSSDPLTERETGVETVLPDAFGEWVFSLEVEAGGELSAEDTVTVTVIPRANAGLDRSAVAPGPIPLYGDQSTGQFPGYSMAYAWSVVSQPADAALTAADLVVDGTDVRNASFSVPLDGSSEPIAGDYEFQLTVTASGVATASDRVVISISADPGDTPPTADAGSDVTVSTGAPIELDGSASFDPDTVQLEYLWQLLSAPLGSGLTAFDIQNASASVATVTPDFPGEYLFRLTVTGGQFSDTDTVAVRVSEPGAPSDEFGDLDLIGYVVLYTGATTTPAGERYASEVYVTNRPVALADNFRDGTLVDDTNALWFELRDTSDGPFVSPGTYTAADPDFTLAWAEVLGTASADDTGPVSADVAASALSQALWETETGVTAPEYYEIDLDAASVAVAIDALGIPTYTWELPLTSGTVLTGSIRATPTATIDQGLEDLIAEATITIDFADPSQPAVDLPASPVVLNQATADSTTITIPQSFASYSWYVGGAQVATGDTFSLNAIDYPPGRYTLSVVVVGSDGLPYSAAVDFEIRAGM